MLNLLDPLCIDFMTFLQSLAYVPFWFPYVISFSLGACIGSFLNVIIYRIPIGPDKRKSRVVFNINAPRSHCPICQHQLAWYENIPIVSWTIQGAKCRNCKTTIPLRYPTIELMVAAISSAAWYTNGSIEVVLLVLTMCMALTPATWWIVSKTKWNKFMLFWLVCILLVSMLIGGYLWTTK